MSLTIKAVTTKEEMKQFICFNYELYKDSEYAVPDLYNDVRDTLDPKKNAAFEFCEAQPFIALRDDKVVGRIVAIINNETTDKNFLISLLLISYYIKQLQWLRKQFRIRVSWPDPT